MSNDTIVRDLPSCNRKVDVICIHVSIVHNVGFKPLFLGPVTLYTAKIFDFAVVKHMLVSIQNIFTLHVRPTLLDTK